MKESIYKGSTRPAMKWGVPLVALVGLFGPMAIVGMWLTVLVTPWTAPVLLLLAIPLFLLLRRITRKDDQRLYQMVLKIRLLWKNRNHNFWKARTYCAHRARRAT
jgi:type IV secretion system protein VirB3